MYRRIGRASRDIAIAIRFSDSLLLATRGAEKSLIAIPIEFLCMTFRNISPLELRAITNPAEAFCTKTLSKIAGLALPLIKIPSRRHLIKVLLATVGEVDSIQTPVPLLIGLVTVTPIN